jgi:hypothetical protein
LHTGTCWVNMKEIDHCQLKWPCAATFPDYDNRIPSICLTKLCGPVARTHALYPEGSSFKARGWLY